MAKVVQTFDSSLRPAWASYREASHEAVRREESADMMKDSRTAEESRERSGKWGPAANMTSGHYCTDLMLVVGTVNRSQSCLRQSETGAVKIEIPGYSD